MSDGMQFNPKQCVWRCICLQQELQTNLSQLSQQLAVTHNDDSQRQDEAGEKECDDESVVMRVTRVPVESQNQASFTGQTVKR